MVSSDYILTLLRSRDNNREVPLPEFLIDINEVKTLVDNPKIEPYNGYVPTTLEQADFNYSKMFYDLRLKHMEDGLLLWRALDLAKNTDMAIGVWLGEKFYGGRPLYTDDELREYKHTMDSLILELGNGDPAKAYQLIAQRIIK